VGVPAAECGVPCAFRTFLRRHSFGACPALLASRAGRRILSHNRSSMQAHNQLPKTLPYQKGCWEKPILIV
jgi:hypothetical protein